MDHPNASDARDFFTPANIAPEHPGVSCAPKPSGEGLQKPIDEKPKCCLCVGEHPANYLDCPKPPASDRRREGEEEKREEKPTSHPNRLKNLSLNGIQTSLTYKKHTSNPCHHLAFPNYNIYRTDRTCRGGGTAILIKRSIPHHEIVINNPSFETTAIKIERTNLQPITVISAYRSPRKPILIQDLHQLFQEPGLRPRRRRPERKTCFLESISPAECRRTYN
ncbi:hypothetical protein TNCV_5108721 [Trichonephila clavipes]|nr:hypothetical protein TNCV_5108721 [Trichonephila clavipes]